jgi:hypothetical protein
MTRVSGGRSRKVGLLSGGEWAVVDMVSGREIFGGQNVESIAEGLSIAEHASSKTRLFRLQARSRWVFSSFEAERSGRKQTGVEEREIEMR